MTETTIYPLRLTFEQRDKVIAKAREHGIDPDTPGALNAYMVRKLMGAVT
jgi:hypothetical protein